MPEETPPLLVISKLPPFFGSFFQFENPQFSAEKPPKIFTAELFYYKILQYEIPILKIVPKQNVNPPNKNIFLNPDAKKRISNSNPNTCLNVLCINYTRP